ncbi:hypothetical protein [Paenibacillus sp. Soil750]|uniref:hypothetical protein n=1 Tax=Paenibacillus sp. Soil750 TaxID=1736398 RepID=UPI000AE90590|nr:hypothetical protein [Paenibacillus sp. Soil750]
MGKSIIGIRQFTILITLFTVGSSILITPSDTPLQFIIMIFLAVGIMASRHGI